MPHNVSCFLVTLKSKQDLFYLFFIDHYSFTCVFDKQLLGGSIQGCVLINTLCANPKLNENGVCHILTFFYQNSPSSVGMPVKFENKMFETTVTLSEP